ncbi:MAG: [NiFe]-hydrogenase assembly chaperone HybE, partial [Roseiarcus sp.]
GFRAHAGRAVGVVVTPWFMNFVAADLPGAPPTPAVRAGASIKMALPAGEVELIVGELPGFGRLDSCSLFSPMDLFADVGDAIVAAREAMQALFDAELLRPREAPAALDRRAFLRGRLKTGAEGAR